MVDITCFRKYGHNELDEPSFTNPLMYKIINQRQSVPNLYKEKLAAESEIDQEAVNNDVGKFRASLDEALDKVLKSNYTIESRNTYLNGNWAHMNLPSTKSLADWSTGCSIDFLKFVGVRSVACPSDFVSF